MKIKEVEPLVFLNLNKNEINFIKKIEFENKTGYEKLNTIYGEVGKLSKNIIVSILPYRETQGLLFQKIG